MVINFSVLNEKISFSWEDVRYIPRIGEKVVLGDSIFIVNNLLWIDKDYIDIKLKRI